MECAIPKGLRFNSIWSVGNASQIGIEAVLEYIDKHYNPEEDSKIDDRHGTGVITSRVDVQREAVMISEDTNILELFLKESQKRKIDFSILISSVN